MYSKGGIPVSAGVEKGLGRKPFFAHFPGESKAPFLCSPQPPSSPSTYVICAYTSPQVVSGPAPPSLSQCRSHVADGVVQEEEPAGVHMLWAYCLWGGHCQPLPAEADYEEPGPGVLSRTTGHAWNFVIVA